MSEPTRCCICLDGFISPRLLPCGHRFCQGCIGEYWRVQRPYRCPLCRASFLTLPQLELYPKDGESEEGAEPLKPGEVSCDICPAKRRAVRSCLQCLASYCAAHLGPHYQDEGLGRHLLIGVAKNLEGDTCALHGRQLSKFCRSDQTCICVLCAQTDHRGHHLLSIKKEATKSKIRLKRKKAKLQQAIQERLAQVEELRSGEQTRRLEEEVSGLGERLAEVEQLLQTEDNLRLLQRCVHTSTSP